MNKPNIRFKSNLIPLIHSGKKTLTYRKGEKYSALETGDIVHFINGETNNKEGKIEIIEKYYTEFKDLPLSSEGHEVYKSREHQKQVFESYYGTMNNEEKMLVLQFKLVN